MSFTLFLLSISIYFISIFVQTVPLVKGAEIIADQRLFAEKKMSGARQLSSGIVVGPTVNLR